MHHMMLMIYGMDESLNLYQHKYMIRSNFLQVFATDDMTLWEENFSASGIFKRDRRILRSEEDSPYTLWSTAKEKWAFSDASFQRSWRNEAYKLHLMMCRVIYS